ncbi:MAG TPA: hypothetical protein V6D17_07100 [Candidatus Obscuribacterales bacterium]
MQKLVPILPSCLIAFAVALSVGKACSAECSAECSAGQEPAQKCQAGREEQAAELKRNFDEFIAHARRLHERTEILLAEAKNLKGRATQLRTVAPNLPPVRLKGREYQQALVQFKADVDKFKAHADEYNDHLHKFRQQIGECSAAQAAYEEACKKYEMHCQQYHMPNIPPPHICIDLNVSASDASNMAHQMMSDQMRAIRAERELRQTEEKIGQLENVSTKVDAHVEKQSERLKREQELAAEFGRLRQEYDLLEVERKVIEGSKTANKPIARPYVSGKVKRP